MLTAPTKDEFFHVEFTNSFVDAFQHLLSETIGTFASEEGGYLIGDYDGRGVIIRSFFHDTAADRSVGHISFSTDAFSHAQELAERIGEMIVGTWHLHPPGYGAGYSRTDVDTLFVDRMVLNATDIGRYEAPWVHVIVPGLDLGGLRAYTLDVSTPTLEAGAVEVVPQEDLSLPPKRRFGLLIADKNEPDKMHFYPASPRYIAPAYRAGRLRGVWRLCNTIETSLRWERIFAENFSRKLFKEQLEFATERERSFTYKRLVPDDHGNVAIQALRFQSPSKQSTELFVPISAKLPADLIKLELENPSLPGERLSVHMSASATVADLMQAVRQRTKIPSAPVLWTLFKDAAADDLRMRTRVEDLGKVFLPEDLELGEALDARVSNTIPIYWESPSLSEETVRRLRTHRLASMGYDLDVLQSSRVVICGLGLLGCEIARILAMMTVGELTLIDSGTVDWVDLYRQSLYEPGNVGEAKVAAAEARLRSMVCNAHGVRLDIPSVLIHDVDDAVAALGQLADTVAGADLVIGALDSYSARAVLQIVARMMEVPFIAAALDYLPELGVTQGTISRYAPVEGQCYGCGSGLKMQRDRGACTNAPIEFPGLVNSLAAKMSIDTLLGTETHAETRRVFHDYRIEHARLGAAADECEVCELVQRSRADRAAWRESVIRWLVS